MEWSMFLSRICFQQGRVIGRTWRMHFGHLWYAFYTLNSLFCTIQLLAVCTCVSEFFFTNAKLWCSKGWSFWSDWSRFRLFSFKCCSSHVQTESLSLFFCNLAYVVNFLIVLLPNRLFLKNFIYLMRNHLMVFYRPCLLCNFWLHIYVSGPRSTCYFCSKHFLVL